MVERVSKPIDSRRCCLARARPGSRPPRASHVAPAGSRRQSFVHQRASRRSRREPQDRQQMAGHLRTPLRDLPAPAFRRTQATSRQERTETLSRRLDCRTRRVDTVRESRCRASFEMGAFPTGHKGSRAGASIFSRCGWTRSRFRDRRTTKPHSLSRVQMERRGRGEGPELSQETVPRLRSSPGSRDGKERLRDVSRE